MLRPILPIKDVIKVRPGIFVEIGNSALCVSFLLLADDSNSIYCKLRDGYRPCFIEIISFQVETIQNKRFHFLRDAAFIDAHEDALVVEQPKPAVLLNREE